MHVRVTVGGVARLFLVGGWSVEQQAMIVRAAAHAPVEHLCLPRHCLVKEQAVIVRVAARAVGHECLLRHQLEKQQAVLVRAAARAVGHQCLLRHHLVKQQAVLVRAAVRAVGPQCLLQCWMVLGASAGLQGAARQHEAVSAAAQQGGRGSRPNECMLGMGVVLTGGRCTLTETRQEDNNSAWGTSRRLLYF